MTIRAKTYKNRKNEQKVQISMNVEEADELAKKVKGEGVVKEFVETLSSALKT